MAALKNYVTSSMPLYITNWLDTNVNPVGSAVVVDKTLKIEGAAADAQITGDNFNHLQYISDFNSMDVYPINYSRLKNYVYKNLTYNSEDDIIHVSGTANSDSVIRVDLLNGNINVDLIAGKKLYAYVEFSGRNINSRIDIFAMRGEQQSITYHTQISRWIDLPDNLSNLIIGIRTMPNQTTDCYVRFHLLWTKPVSALDNEVSALDNEVSALDNDFTVKEVVNIDYESVVQTTQNYTYTVNNNIVHIVGTNPTTSYQTSKNFVYKDVNLFKNKSIFIFCERTGNIINSRARLFWRQGSINLSALYLTQSISDVSVPENADNIILRIENLPGKTDTYIRIHLLSAIPNILLPQDSSTIYQINKAPLADGTDLNNIVENSAYILNSAYTYANLPEGINAGYLFTYKFPNKWCLQLIYTLHSGIIFKRSVPDEWKAISAGDSIINNYNITSTPTIMTDTNNYLASSADDTDRTSDILTMLGATGICNLGPGTFYISNLDMPDGTTIRGSGYTTKVILNSSVTEGYAIKIGVNCTISDLQLTGTNNSISKPTENGKRNGIVWESDYAESHANKLTRGLVNNVFIKNFTGSGMYFYNTGYGTANGILTENVWISYCWTGVNIEYWSEFNRFTNVSVNYCTYGCINNGGNNVFANCSFTSNTTGILMDNTNNDKTNNSHGTYTGCTIDHSGSNTGIAIHVINMNSEIFTGLQVFYGQCIFELNNNQGMVLSSSNFGNANIELIGDGILTVSDCSFSSKFQGKDYIINRGNGKIIAHHNYERSGNEIIVVNTTE